MLYSRQIDSALTESQILLGPVALLALVAVVVLAILVQRVRTFNDCPDAAKELIAQIKVAREDLASKGFKFE